MIDPEVRFDYTVPGPRHLVRVIDTRTRRTYRGRLGPPKLLGSTLDAQLPPGPLTDGRELLVVVSPVPILMPHALEALVQPLAAGIIDFTSNAKRKAEADHDGPPVSGPERFDVEGWGGDEESFHALVRRLATYPRCVILSGDVHFSSGITLDFWSGQDPTVDSRIVQLTSSPVRNSAAEKIRAAIFSARFSQQLLLGLELDRLGWAETSSITVPPGQAISPARRSRMRATPAVVPAGGWPTGTTIPADKPPDFRFRITGIRDNRLRAQLEHPEHLQPPLPTFDVGDPLQTYHEVAGRHAELALGPTELLRLLVFRSNLGVVRFEAEGDSHTVVHELLSMDGPDSTEGGAYTIHRASLALAPAPRRPDAGGRRRWLTRRPRRRRGSSRQVAQLVKDLAEWVEETFSDSELSAEIRDDLGLDRSNPATPAAPDGARRARIEAFAAKEDIDEASLLAVVADIKAEVDAIIDFIEAAKADQVDARVLFATLFKVFALDMLRVRNPAAYALVRLAGVVLDDEEFLQQLDAAALQQLVRGEGPAVDGEAWVQRLTMLGGVTLVVLAAVTKRLGAVIDAVYGWDPDPEDEGEAAAIASRALTVTLDHQLLGVARPALTLIPVPRGHGGPGVYVGATAGVSLPMTVGDTTYTFDIVGAGQFGLVITGDGVRTFASFAPKIRVGAEPYKGGATDPEGNPIPAPPMDTPALVVGTTDGSRLEIGALAYGIEISGEGAAFRLTVRNGKLVIALGKGDSFLRQLPGGNIEAPFDVSLVGSTSTGIHFEGGTRLRVNLPVSASLFGVFTVQFLELELVMDPEVVAGHPGRVLAHARAVRRVHRPSRRVARAAAAR